jgi:preprotein translocase subunit SecE
MVCRGVQALRQGPTVVRVKPSSADPTRSHQSGPTCPTGPLRPNLSDPTSPTEAPPPNALRVAQITPSTTQSHPGRPEGNGSGAPEPLRDDADDAALEETTEAGGFAAEVMAELRKVVWPSRQQLFSESVAVILMVGLSAATIAAVDRFYRWLSLQVFR